MKSPFISAVLLAALVLPAVSATVNTGLIETYFEVVSPPRVTSVNQSTTITVDLSSLSGLTPGSDIGITFSSASVLLWVGRFDAEVGDLTLNFNGRLTLAAGAFSSFTDSSWSLGPLPFDNTNPGGGATTPVSGYSNGPVPSPFTLTVPWGTDLSAISLTLTDTFSLIGADPFIELSTLELADATITTSSVPEPATLILTMSACGLLLFRRRNA